MRILKTSEMQALVSLAGELGIPPLWLAALIDVESGHDPSAANIYLADGRNVSWNATKALPSGARWFAMGLNQIVPDTASGMGLPGGISLYRSYPTYASQMLGPTRAYLKRPAPFSSLQDLALSNVAPAYRSAPGTTLSAKQRAANPSLVTFGDYANVVTARANKIAKAFDLNRKAVGLYEANPTLTVGAALGLLGVAGWAAWKYL